MNIVQIWGGLGNQMFQYAFAKALEHRTKEPVWLDLRFFFEEHDRQAGGRCCVREYELERCYGIRPANLATPELLRRLRLRHPFRWALARRFPNRPFSPLRRDPGKDPLAYDPAILAPAPFDLYFKGYWQNFRWLEPVQDQIRHAFTFDHSKLSPEGRQLLTRLRAKPTIAIHIRRTDFVGSQHETNPSDIHAAIRQIPGHQHLNLAVFSDDIPWCRANLALPTSTLYASHPTQPLPAEDLYLISQAAHHILAPGSSFSRWAAWLGSAPGKHVVCPPKGIIPLHNL